MGEKRTLHWFQWGKILLRGKGQIIYLMAAGGSRCNYWQNYVKQMAMPINLNLQFLKAEREFWWLTWVLPPWWVGFWDGAGRKKMLALWFAWQGGAFPQLQTLYTAKGGVGRLQPAYPTSPLPPAVVNKVLLEHSHTHSSTYFYGPICTAVAELHSYGRDCMSPNAKTM